MPVNQFFVSIQDGPQTGLLLGPFANETSCRKYAYFDPKDGGSDLSHQVRNAVHELDPRSHFMAWGMLKIKDVKPEENFRGVLNRVDPGKWDKVIS